MRKELQQALPQESRDKRDQTLRHQACQTEYADEVSTREISQVRHMVTEREDAMVRLEAHFEEYAHRQQTLFLEFDSAIKEKDVTLHALQHELANQKEHAITELEQARMDAERVANMSRPVFADGLSTQPYAPLVKKKTVHAVAAVAHAVPVPAHSPNLLSWCFCRQSQIESKK